MLDRFRRFEAARRYIAFEHPVRMSNLPHATQFTAPGDQALLDVPQRSHGRAAAGDDGDQGRANETTFWTSTEDF